MKKHFKIALKDGFSKEQYGDREFSCEVKLESFNNAILRSFESKTFRSLINVQWFVSNDTFHHDLFIPTIKGGGTLR